MEITDRACITYVVAKFDAHWMERWNTMEREVTAIKVAQTAGFTTLEANQQQEVEESKKYFKSIKSHQIREIAKFQEESER